MGAYHVGRVHDDGVVPRVGGGGRGEQLVWAVEIRHPRAGVLGEGVAVALDGAGRGDLVGAGEGAGVGRQAVLVRLGKGRRLAEGGEGRGRE